MADQKKNDADLKAIAKRARLLHRQGMLPARVARELEKIPGWTWNVLEYRFNTRLQLNVEFKNKHGIYARVTCQNPLEINEKTLGEWLSTQRKAYKLNNLSDDRIQKMIDAFPDFLWDLEDHWDEKLQHNVEFRNKHRIFAKEKTKNPLEPNEKELGVWLRYQKTLFKKNLLSIERIQKINDAFPDFPWEDNKEEVWDKSLQLNVEFKNKHKIYSRNNPQNPLQSNEKQLGAWLNTQRIAFKTNKLSSERIQKINDVFPNFPWDPRDNWDEKLQLNIEFKNKHKIYAKTKPKNPLQTNEEELGKWLSRQKTAFKSNNLSDERIKKINNAFPDFRW